MDQKELFERLEELELEDFEVKEAKTSIPKSSFETVSAFSNTNGWKAYYENEPVSLNVVDFYKIASPLVKITKASEKTLPAASFPQQAAYQCTFQENQSACTSPPP
jgi:hypothetical protein